MDGSVKTRMFVKKRYLICIAGIMIALAILAGLSPQAAKADENTPSLLDYECSRYGYNNLSAGEKALYDELYDNLVAFTLSDDYKTETLTTGNKLGEVSFADSENKELLAALSGEQINHTYEVFRADQPIFYFLGRRYGVMEGDTGYLFATPDKNYLTPASRNRVDAYIIHYREEWLAAVNAIKNDNDDTDDLTDDVYDIARLLHDLIINRIDYATTTAGEPVIDTWAHNIDGVFTGRGGVCESYAKAYKYMLDVAGVDNIYITGLADGELHSWNAVKIGENWCLVDVTWDDLKTGPDSAAKPAGFFDWFMCPEPVFNTKHAPNLNMYALPDFYDDRDFLYYERYESLYKGEAPISTEGEATAFVAAARSAAPGAYMYFVIPNTDNGEVDSDTLFYIARATGFVSGKIRFYESLFGTLYISVDEEKLQVQPDPWCYPGDESGVFVEIIEGGTETIWAKGNKDHSKVTLKTSLKPSSYLDSKGKTKKGKVGFVVLAEDTGITFDADSHKVLTRSDKNPASVSGKGVVSAKTPGTAYVYAYDTGAFRVEKFVINILAAPTKVYLTDAPGIIEKDYLVKKLICNPGVTEKIYITETAGGNQVDITTTYSVIIDGKGKNGINATEVRRDDKGALFFEVTAKEKPASADKVLTAKISVVNGESGKKASFTAMLTNPVDGLVVKGSGELKNKGDKVELNVSCLTPFGNGLKTTDSVKVYVALSEPDIDEKKITYEKATEIKVKWDKKTGSLTIAAGKDIKEGGSVWFYIRNKAGDGRFEHICTIEGSGTLSVNPRYVG